MADELYNCAVVVKGLMGELKPTVKKTHLGHPGSVVTELEVAVITDRLRHHQGGTMAHGQRHYLMLVGYAPMSADLEVAEKKLLKLWNLMIDKLNSNVTLKGTATHSNLERARLGYRVVAGVKCRTLEALLNVYLLQTENYQP